MAYDTSDLLLKLSPTGYLGGGKPKEDMSMERERLALMREQFENTKQQQAQAAELGRIEESGRMARAQLEHQTAMQQLDAKQAEATKAKKLDAYSKFTELNGKGDIEGARAMVPMMSALGMGVDLEGEDGGLPRYRVNMDADSEADQETNQKFQAAKAGIGYDTNNDSGDLPQAPGISSTADAFGAAQQASRYSEQTGQPYMKPDAPDYTGAVPKNVIDTGAMNGAMQARLNPAMSGIIGGLPAEYQDSARSTASGLGGLGLPAEKTMEMFGKQQGDANALITGELNRDAEAQKAARAEAAATYAARTGADKEGFDRYDTGFNKIGKEIGDQYNLKGRKQTRSLNQQAMDILRNSTQEDDYLVLSLISRSFGERGATTEGDVARALGLPATSTWDQITGWMTQKLEGGIPEPNKRALLGVLKKAITSNDGELRTASQNMLSLADDPETDKDVARGVRDYWRTTIPADLRGEHKKATSGPSGVTDSGAPEKTGAVTIPEESRIAAAHNNPGNLKFAGQESATEGEAAQDGGKWAKFPSVEAGLEALRKQIEKDAERGQTVREFITKYAPPGSNDTEAYIKQAAESLRAKPDDKLSDLDTYDVMRFVAQKESGTKLPDQYSEPAADAMAKQTEAETAIADDAGAGARKARLAELRKKYGRTP